MSDLYALAAGYNVAQGSLALITSITPGGDEAFSMPLVWPLYNPGETKARLSGTLYSSGYASIEWRFGRLTFLQWDYLSSTYCSGGLSGLVTVYTTLNNKSTYVRRNAIMTLKKPNELTSEGYWYTRAPVLFTKLEVPT
jgi:hypothetical protein